MRYFLSHIVIVEFRRCRLVLYKKNVLVLRLKYTCLYACVLCVCVSACVYIYIYVYMCVYVCIYIYISVGLCIVKGGCDWNATRSLNHFIVTRHVWHQGYLLSDILYWIQSLTLYINSFRVDPAMNSSNRSSAAFRKFFFLFFITGWPNQWYIQN